MSEIFITDRKKQFGIIVTVCFSGFMILLDSSIVNISLPAISRYFNSTMSKTALISLAYLLVLTSTLIASGKLADRIGLKKIFICGYLLFAFGSLLCGISLRPAHARYFPRCSGAWRSFYVCRYDSHHTKIPAY